MFIAWILALAATMAQAPAPRAAVQPDGVALGTVMRGTVVVSEFVLSNGGTAPLLVQGLELTSGLRMDRMAAHVPPGGRVTIRLALDTTALEGRFEERATLRLNDPTRPVLELTITGEIVPPIQVLPRPGVALVSPRGARTQATLEIVNHTPDPVRLAAPEHRQDRFTSELTTIEDGRRYRLTLTMLPDAPPGKDMVPIVIRTDSTAAPVVRVAVATYVRDRVYTFPDAIDLGAVPLAEWRRSPAALAQTLMVYQVGGTAFEASFSSDIPGLRIEATRGRAGDRWQATLTLEPSDARVGAIRGAVIVATNDPEFPRVVVPVTGAVLPDPPAQ